MKSIKKILPIIILMFLLISPVRTSAENKEYVTVSTDQDFSLNSIIVQIMHEESMKIKTYTPDDFKEVTPDEIVDLNPWEYEELVKFWNNEIDRVDEKLYLTFRRSFTLKWKNDLTKEEIIEKIHILEEREDIYLVQPNYLYVPASGNPFSEIDDVEDDIWQNYYYIKVIKKDSSTYVNKEVIEAQLLTSYDELVNLKNEYDAILENSLENNNFKFIVSKDVYQNITVGSEYIIKLDKYDDIRVKNKGIKYTVLKYVEDDLNNLKFINVINNRLYFPSVKELDTKDGYYFNPVSVFTKQFNQYLFKKEIAKTDLPFEFELKNSFGLIRAVVSEEDKDKFDPSINYTYYVIKRGNFLFSGDNVLMFAEYIKLAKQVYDSGDLFEYYECGTLRQEALERISNFK